MKTIKTFKVRPAIPERLKPLLKLAYNSWWTWNPAAIELFRRIDLDLWTLCNHNPIDLLSRIPQSKFNELEESESFCSNMDLMEVELDRHLLYHPTWFDKENKFDSEFQAAYFSAEFGIHECLPIYSGGLGVLAGDHLKSADEIGLPLIGVGLCYRLGYFRQRLNADGWQQEVLPENDFGNMIMRLVKDEQHKPILVDVEIHGRRVYSQIWKVQVGTVPLYLLDANIEVNSPEDREITAQLYGGNEENRIKQEIILGIGGIKALKAMDLNPTVHHMNEGHSAFLAVERIRNIMTEKSLSFAEAKELVSVGNVFTTHTPVSAGLDLFQPYLIDKYLASYYDKLGIAREDFLGLGRTNPHDNNEPFSMATLAISLSYSINGVSQLHGDVSRKMWHKLWDEVPFEEIPIQSVTNGIHTRSWLADEVTGLFNRYLGPLWVEDPLNREVWQRVDYIPDTELWRSKVRLKERLISFGRFKLISKLKRVGAPQFEIKRADEVLDPEALTICFARRFATYKRALLIMKDKERLANILNNKDYPVQLIFAGKAHPHDNEGKEFIRQIIHLSRDERFRTKIMFIEDYDMNIARYMVQGADIWMNTPRRPLEASGTSGMKAAANGGLNLSVLDGWWCEGYNAKNGWAIGGGEVYDDQNYQDEVESNALFDLLEQEIVPRYYRRGPDGLSRTWITMIKEAMKSIGPVFNTNRMVKEYAEKLYFPSHRHCERLMENDSTSTKDLVVWKNRINKLWHQVKVETIEHDPNKNFEVGSEVEIHSKVKLGSLTPDDVSVELYYGTLDSRMNLSRGHTIVMESDKKNDHGVFDYSGRIRCTKSGQYGFSVRIMPKHEDLVTDFDTRLIRWG